MTVEERQGEGCLSVHYTTQKRNKPRKYHS